MESEFGMELTSSLPQSTVAGQYFSLKIHKLVSFYFSLSREQPLPLNTVH
jgi:hypothetical protein